jgi:hypothetical protein
MIETYLIGSIGQSLERVRQLRQIVQKPYSQGYKDLRQICLRQLDEMQSTLRRLADESIVNTTLQTPRRVREFKRVMRQLNAVEGVGVFALSRTSPDDDFLNRLIAIICDEIAYPLNPPTISHISQDYFHIYRDFNLLCMPLMESRFLLHLPDIYHELCHPFHQVQDTDLPRLESYHNAYKHSLFEMVKYFRDQVSDAERLRKPAGKFYHLHLWHTCWVKYWMQEFFCDLFGVFTTGPAFAWSHYHLCVKRGGDPFETTLVFESTHPADDARMQAALMMLKMIGFEPEAKLAKIAWQDYVRVMGYNITAEYQQCYPEHLLFKIASAAKKGIEGIGVTPPNLNSQALIVRLLNAAWKEFWRTPEDYQVWETNQLNTLRPTLSTV